MQKIKYKNKVAYLLHHDLKNDDYYIQYLDYSLNENWFQIVKKEDCEFHDEPKQYEIYAYEHSEDKEAGAFDSKGVGLHLLTCSEYEISDGINISLSLLKPNCFISINEKNIHDI